MIPKKSDSISPRNSRPKTIRIKSKQANIKKDKKIDPVILAQEPAKMKAVLKIITFIALIIFVAAVAGAIFLYINPASFQSGESLDKAELNFSTILNLQLPITLESEPSQGSVNGRIIENTIESAYSPTEALLESRSLIGLKITDAEYLWPESLTELPAKEDFILPMAFKWLYYSKDDVKELLTELAKDFLPSGTHFSIQNISYNKLEATDNPNIYLLSSQLNLTTDKFIDVIEYFTDDDIEEAETILEPEKIIEYLKIIETSTGWLNVRTGPGIGYDIMTKVDIGEEFEILDQAEGWYQINLSKKQKVETLEDISEGWVYGLYIEKINNDE